MNYSYYECDLSANDIVSVSLDRQANVILLDRYNYNKFRNGQNYSYYGGLATISPFNIEVPTSGHWYVVINLGGYSGSVRHSMEVIQ